MTTSSYAPLTFEEYGAAIGAAATVLRANATSVPLGAAVPTCPGWSVADLVVHVGMVHRWCADTLRGAPADPAAHEAAGRASTDLLQWFDDGASAMLDALSKTPEDWDGRFFLRTAENARDGWARRQCHETTVHALDAMAARLGRLPTGDEVWFSRALALDGVDELLMGFLPRRSSPLRADAPVTIEVRATDADAAWTVTVSDEPPRVSRGGCESADARWRAPDRALYPALWNRGDEIVAEHESEAGRSSRGLWTGLMRVTWS